MNEPFCESSVSNEDYLSVINKLSEFTDSTFTFGESLLKKIEEASIYDELLRETADKIAKKSEELVNTGSTASLSFLRRTKEAIGNQLSCVANSGNSSKVS